MAEQNNAVAITEAKPSPRDQFMDKAHIGDIYFHVQTWPSWFIKTDTKSIVPVTRLYVGDSNGEVILERSVLLDGMLDLISELVDAVQLDLSLATDMEGFSLDTPNNKEDLVGLIDDISRQMERVKQHVTRLSFDADKKSSSTDATTEPA